ncbi:ATP-grasp domain-containing protein [Neobacillus cucumis]|uniref:Carbamoyl-phosphate synthase large subunit n=1 Tax=Neobacillus cucumis TaxID=1740721 RepID=A0A2N5H6E6_9BACI|nr:ATP-grasp domain-containing protein [Neobacillus cucumis]PLS01107.1 carbamoyl-phosphate synthase large subunit [Neobacillus cucumis]
MANILVTSIGSFAADIVIKTLKANGHYVVGCDIYRKEWIADAYNVNAFEQAPSVLDMEAYLEFIIKICKKYDVRYVIPLIDLEVDLLCVQKDFLLNQYGIIICTSNEETIKKCRDKYILPEYLKEIGINKTIPTMLLKETNVKDVNFPVIVKPRSGRSSQGFFILKNREELNYFITCNKIDDYIIQPYIEGDIIVVDVIKDLLSKKVVSISRKELLRNKSGAGTTVEIISNRYLTGLCEYIANKLNIIGAVCFEFISTKEDDLYFLEINPRFSGGVEFSHLAGYNVVLNHLGCYMNIPIEPDATIHKGMIIARKYEEYVTRMDHLITNESR